MPLLNASITDAVFEMQRPVTAEEVNDLFREAEHSYLKGILGVEERPLVSIDFKGDPRSAIIDALSTMRIDPLGYLLSRVPEIECYEAGRP